MRLSACHEPTLPGDLRAEVSGWAVNPGANIPQRSLFLKPTAQSDLRDLQCGGGARRPRPQDLSGWSHNQMDMRQRSKRKSPN